MNTRLRRLLGQKPEEMLDEVVRRVAKLDGLHAEQAAIIDTCERMLKRIKPDQDWWRYAALMQKRADAIVELNHWADRSNKAREQLDALIGDNP